MSADEAAPDLAATLKRARTIADNLAQATTNLDRMLAENRGDVRGNGQYLAEVAMQRYGAASVTQIMLTANWYLENMPKLKAAFEDGTLESLPADADTLEDLRSITMIKGIPRIPEGKTKSSSGQRHGDTAVALCIGAVVCIGSANAGATSQDLKTGYLLGATPSRQQVGLMLGVTFSTLVIGLTMSFMDKAYTQTVPAEAKSIHYTFRAEEADGPKVAPGDVSALRPRGEAERKKIEDVIATQGLVRKNVIGSKDLPDGAYLVGAQDHQVYFVIERGIGGEKLPAPQGQLMATVINGILNQKLPWNLILIGVFAALVLELCGIKSLPFAVGVYLPLSTTSPIFIGGVVKKLVDWRQGRKDGDEEGEASTGVLYSSGLIAGGALAGLAVAIVAMMNAQEAMDFGAKLIWGKDGRAEPMGLLVALGCFVALSVSLYRMGMKRESDPEKPGK